MLDIPEVITENGGSSASGGTGSNATAGNTEDLNYRLNKYGYNAGATTTTQAPRGGYLSKGYLDANGAIINGQEYKFWTHKLNAPRGLIEQAQDNFHNYVPYPSQKETVYGVINKTKVKSELITAVKERMFQINSHLTLLSYVGGNIQVSANTPPDLSDLILKGFAVIASIVPATKPIGIITSLYIGYTTAKEKAELMADLNDVQTDVRNLTNEAKKLSEKLKENNITGEDLTASNNLLARSAKLSNTQWAGLGLAFLGGVLLIKKFKKRKK